MKVEYEGDREARIIDDRGIIVAKVYLCTDGLLVCVEEAKFTTKEEC